MQLSFIVLFAVEDSGSQPHQYCKTPANSRHYYTKNLTSYKIEMYATLNRSTRLVSSVVSATGKHELCHRPITKDSCLLCDCEQAV